MDDRVPRHADARAKPVRAFFAIWPDVAARERLTTLASEVARSAGGRATAAAKAHITVAFVGSVASERVDALRDAGDEATRGACGFELSLERIGGAHGGELVWLAPERLPTELAALHASLDAALRRHRFAIERREFRPHVTLARRCARRAQIAAVEPIGWRVTRLALMQSTSAASGSEYRELAGWPLS
jgi:2'-5' RNA ligase